MYQLPWQSTNGYGSFVKALGHDWQINGTLGAFSGNPFRVDANGASLNTPSNQQLADLTGTFNVTGNAGSEGTWFDPTAFSQPTGVRFGNTTRNQFYGPGGWNLDLSAFRAFPLGGTSPPRPELPGTSSSGVFANPANNITSSTFAITAVANNGAAYPERQFAWGSALASEIAE